MEAKFAYRTDEKALPAFPAVRITPSKRRDPNRITGRILRGLNAKSSRLINWPAIFR